MFPTDVGLEQMTRRKKEQEAAENKAVENKTQLYMVVTADEYELPRYFADTIKEIADYTGLAVSSIRSNICRGSVRRSGPWKGCKIIRVEVGDE